MKRIMVMLLALMLTLLPSLVPVQAEVLGVQVITNNSSQSVATSLDDIQLGETYTIDGYATVKPVEARYVDAYAKFNRDADRSNVGSQWADDYPGSVYYQSEALNGKRAGYYKEAYWYTTIPEYYLYYWLRIDITNLQKKPVKFGEESSVKIVYDNDYVLEGYVLQANFDYNSAVYYYGMTAQALPYAMLDENNEEAINPIYTGVYNCLCYVPDFVVKDEVSPLQMIITLGENELSYNIPRNPRKGTIQYSSSFDNIQLNHYYKVDSSYCFTPLSFDFFDSLEGLELSGANADYAAFRVQVTNLKKETLSLRDIATIMIIYDNDYSFSGKLYYTVGSSTMLRDYSNNGGWGSIINQLGKGDIYFVCKVPNEMISDKKAPLRMEVTFDGVEWTYIIRK